MAGLQLEQVRKVYPGGHVAIEGASVEVADGELLVLVGPSGCGKSTLLRMIAGLETITSGTLRIGGRVVNDVAPRDRDIAMVFQNYALYPHMSVAENLGFALRLRGLSRAEVEARVRAAAATLELEPLLARRPAALSGGQRQRVALGRALVRDPKVFLLDEPLSNLDAKLRMSMRVEIARLHRQLGTTMVYVTHDQVEAMTLGHRIVVLDGGVVQQIDTPLALYDRPANLFVATFLGSPAMNVLRGRLLDGGGPALELADGLRLPLEGARADTDWTGRELAVGVRPEDLVPGPPGSPEMLVEVVEPVGNEVFVNLRAGSHALVARFPPSLLPRPGERLPVALRAGHVHWFDPIFGKRLQPPPP